MRSFIKLHRKFDTNTSDHSDLEFDTNVPAVNSKNHSNTPTSSPTIPQGLQFTPPQVSNSTLSSPKKLLTPIKNLFLSSNTSVKGLINPPTSGDTLNSIVSGKSKVKGRRRDEHPTQGINGSEFQATFKHITPDTNFHKLPRGEVNQDRKYVANTDIKSATPEFTKLPVHQLDVPYMPNYKTLDSRGSQKEGGLQGPYESAKKDILSNSVLSIGSDNKFSRKVSFKSPKKENPKNDSKNSIDSINELESDEETFESDTSSQFSFVRDKRGGRNTSVKYYKTQKSPQENKNNLYIDQFNVNDSGFAESDLSDYDYENNGYEEYSDDNPENDQSVQYNKLFDDEINSNIEFEDQLSDPFYENELDIRDSPGVGLQNSLINNGPYMPNLKADDKKFKVFNKSLHSSIEGIDKITENIQEPTHIHDILENYLEVKETSSPYENKSIFRSRETLEFSSSENLQLFDLNSPLINGLTIGNNLRHRDTSHRNTMANSKNSSRNNIFIHRHIGMNENFPPSSSDGYLQGPFSSFHSSISDDLIFKIKEKTKQFDIFSDNHTSLFKDKYEKADKLEFKDIDTSSDNHEEDTPEDTPEVVIEEVDNPKVNSTEIEIPNNPEVGKVEVDNKEIFSVPSKFAKNESQLIVDLDKDLKSDSLSSEGTNESKTNRKSIENMMSALASIELTSSLTTTNKRSSVDNMMNTLKLLEIPEDPNSKTRKNSQKRAELQDTSLKNISLVHTVPKSTKRYSWIDNDEYSSFSTSQKELLKSNMRQKRDGLDDLDYERSYPVLSEELIDEINSLPEDFDFEVHERKKYEIPTTPRGTPYHRSNSYLKKPVKSIVDNKYASTKIETMNKTVTFYRSNSCNSDFERSRSISRAASVLSSDSTRELIEEEESEEDPSIYRKELSPDADKRETPNFHKSFESISRHSSNLVTISETDIPGRYKQNLL